MEVLFLRPSKQLQKYIRSYRLVQVKGGLTKQFSSATTRFALCFPLKKTRLDYFLLDHTCVFEIPYFQGIFTNPFSFQISSDGACCLLVEFEDLGFMAFFDFDPKKLHNALFPANMILKSDQLPRFSSFVEQINALVDFENLDTYINLFFENLLAFNTESFLYLNEKKYLFEQIVKACTLLRQSNGEMLLENLAQEIGMSPRHLRRVFLEMVGVSPKAFGLLVKFTHAYTQARILQKLENWSLLDHKYHDQMHLIRSFRRFTGFLPTFLPGDSYVLADELIAINYKKK